MFSLGAQTHNPLYHSRTEVGLVAAPIFSTNFFQFQQTLAGTVDPEHWADSVQPHHILSSLFVLNVTECHVTKGRQVINVYEKEAENAHTKLLEMLCSEESSCWEPVTTGWVHQMCSTMEPFLRDTLTAPWEAPKCQLATRTLQLLSLLHGFWPKERLFL